MGKDITFSSLDTDQELPPETLSKDGAVHCVFSSIEKIKVGTGTTTRFHESRILWFVEELGNKKFSVRKINPHNVPSGEDQVIGLTKLLEEYTPEIAYYEENTLPAMELLEDYLDDGEDLREDGKYYSAEGCFNKALGLDEQNVRALFNLGLIYLEIEDEDKTREVMRELLKIKSAFVGKDQHLFNEFGIRLRKDGMFNEAVEYYSKALSYVCDDDHLYYNLARANFERGTWEECVDALSQCCTLNPELDAARDLCELVVKCSTNPRLCEKQGKPPVPPTLADDMRGVMQMDHPVTSPRAKTQRPEKGRVRSLDVEEGVDDGKGEQALDAKVENKRAIKRGNGYSRSYEKK